MQYVVTYGLQVLGADALPENERWAFGKMTVTTDEAVTVNDKDKLEEIGRTIGLEKGYEAVAIIDIKPYDEALEQGEIILEGEIVDDSE